MPVKRGADFVVIPEYVQPKKPLRQRVHPSINAANSLYEGKWNRVNIGGKRYRIPMNVYEWYIRFAKRWRQQSSKD